MSDEKLRKFLKQFDTKKPTYSLQVPGSDTTIEGLTPQQAYQNIQKAAQPTYAVPLPATGDTLKGVSQENLNKLMLEKQKQSQVKPKESEQDKRQTYLKRIGELQDWKGKTRDDSTFTIPSNQMFQFNREIEALEDSLATSRIREQGGPEFTRKLRELMSMKAQLMLDGGLPAQQIRSLIEAELQAKWGVRSQDLGL